MWPKVDGSIILSFELKKMPRRPKRDRKKEQYEVEGAEYSRKGIK